MRTLRSVALLMAVLITGAAGLKAQSPIMRAEARETLVDVTVTDRRGVPAPNLTAKDFSIWEDGKPQKITSVSGAEADPATVQKHFVLYFDFSMMRQDDQAASERFAAGFIDAMASPDRFMAVATFGATGARILQDFTTAKTVLKKAVAAPMNANPFLSILPGNPPGLAYVARSLSAICGSIAPADGRKALLLFTGSYSVGSDPLAELITTCNRANVAIYAISASLSAGGTGSDVNRPQPTNIGVVRNLDTQPAATLAQSLAAATGGKAFSLSETLPTQLAATAREQDDYYRIAYVPPPAKEGSCHTIKVSTSDRGLTIRARNEYCTEKPVDLVAGKIAGQALESSATGAHGVALSASMQLPWFYTGTNRASVRLVMDFIPAGMKFEKDKNGFRGQIDVVATALTPEGATAARFADTVNIDLPDQQRVEAFRQKLYHYEHPFLVAAGTYTLQAAVGVGPTAVGNVKMPLTVPAWRSGTLGISGIALSSEVRPLDAEASEGPVLEGRGPLVAGGKQFIPSATNRFRRSDQVYFYTEVSDPSLSEANPAPITMQFRILDRKSGDVKTESAAGRLTGFVRIGNPLVPVATHLPVDQLPPGSYRLQVGVAAGTASEGVFQTVDFDLD